MIKLIIDEGNTLCKLYLFRDENIIFFKAVPYTDLSESLGECLAFQPKLCIISSVLSQTATGSSLPSSLKVLPLSSGTPLPFGMKYQSPQTLGSDRIAAAAGAWQLFGKGPVLAVMTGTCITYNLIDTAGNFIGGAISPGLHMRLKAMHEYTAKLPLASSDPEAALTGTDTLSSLQSGAEHGFRSEIQGMIQRYANAFPGLQTVISGGDLDHLAEAPKNGIFARPHLVAEGLNFILEHNAARILS